MSDEKTEFIEYELACLWSDLEWAERQSLASNPATPSIGMEMIMERIKRATALVGPISWTHISMVFVVNGRYEYWAIYMGIEYNLPTEEDLSKLTSELQKAGLV